LAVRIWSVLRQPVEPRGRNPIYRSAEEPP
jgi:hypothetical protein